jgi:hypothetical protein
MILPGVPAASEEVANGACMNGMTSVPEASRADLLDACLPTPVPSSADASNILDGPSIDQNGLVPLASPSTCRQHALLVQDQSGLVVPTPTTPSGHIVLTYPENASDPSPVTFPQALKGESSLEHVAQQSTALIVPPIAPSESPHPYVPPPRPFPSLQMTRSVSFIKWLTHL